MIGIFFASLDQQKNSNTTHLKFNKLNSLSGSKKPEIVAIYFDIYRNKPVTSNIRFESTLTKVLRGCDEKPLSGFE